MNFLPRWYVPPHKRMIKSLGATRIIEAVAIEFGLTTSEMRSACRKRHKARARQAAWYLIHRHCDHVTYPMMARMLGKKDHTTAMHGVATIGNLITRDDELAKALARIEQAVRV